MTGELPAGLSAAVAGDRVRARDLADEAVADARFEDTPALTVALTQAAHTAVALGEPLRAAELLREALSYAGEGAAPVALIVEMSWLAAVLAAHRGLSEDAAVLFGAVDALRDRLGESAPEPPYGAGFARQRVKAAIGADGLESGLKAGAALTAGEAVLVARRVVFVGAAG